MSYLSKMPCMPKVSSKVLLLVSSLLLATYAQADTNKAVATIEKESQFITLLNQSEDSIKARFPTWQSKSPSLYKPKGAPSLNLLLNKLKQIDSFNEICHQAMGSTNLCINGAEFVELLPEEYKLIKAPMTLEDINSSGNSDGNGIGTLISDGLKNTENLELDDDTFILWVDTFDDTFDIASDVYYPKVDFDVFDYLKNNINNDLKVDLDDESLFITVEGAHAFSGYISRIIGEVARYNIARTKQCTLNATTQKQLYETIDNNGAHSDALTEFWLNNEDTKSYDDCIQNALNTNGFNKEYNTIIAVMNFLVDMADKGLLSSEMLDAFDYDDLDEELIAMISAIKLAQQNSDNYHLGVVKQENGGLALNAELTEFSLNGKDCALNKQYCIDNSESFLLGSGKAYDSSDMASCTINGIDYQGVVCNNYASQLYMPNIISERLLDDSPGMGYVLWQLNESLQGNKMDYTIGDDDRIHDSAIATKIMNDKIKNKQLNNSQIRFSFTKTPSLNDAQTIWVVDSIMLVDKALEHDLN